MEEQSVHVYVSIHERHITWRVRGGEGRGGEGEGRGERGEGRRNHDDMY